jgi:hypothetical protein
MTAADELEEIRQLKARYFRFLDTKDWDGLRSVLADNVVAIVDTAVSTNGADGMSGPKVTGADEFVRAVRDAVAPCVTVHHGHMPEITLTSETTATGIWAMEDVVTFPEGHTLYGAGHYHETYAKADGTWRIASLHLTRTRQVIRKD